MFREVKRKTRAVQNKGKHYILNSLSQFTELLPVLRMDL